MEETVSVRKKGTLPLLESEEFWDKGLGMGGPVLQSRVCELGPRTGLLV